MKEKHNSCKEALDLTDPNNINFPQQVHQEVSSNNLPNFQIFLDKGPPTHRLLNSINHSNTQILEDKKFIIIINQIKTSFSIKLLITFLLLQVAAH
jgi:hypothetical protein